VALHVVIIVIVPTFAALCVWQVNRALAGNDLSWAYVFEWPFFAGYAVYMWWRFVHEAPPDPVRPSPERSNAPNPTSDPGADDADLAAYNQYLADLAAQDKPKQWR
jgi:hypothetical protein